MSWNGEITELFFSETIILVIMAKMFQKTTKVNTFGLNKYYRPRIKKL